MQLGSSRAECRVISFRATIGVLAVEARSSPSVSAWKSPCSLPMCQQSFKAVTADSLCATMADAGDGSHKGTSFQPVKYTAEKSGNVKFCMYAPHPALLLCHAAFSFVYDCISLLRDAICRRQILPHLNSTLSRPANFPLLTMLQTGARVLRASLSATALTSR
eukprot:158179-Rhodomonas_salina.3